MPNSPPSLVRTVRIRRSKNNATNKCHSDNISSHHLLKEPFKKDGNIVCVKQNIPQQSSRKDENNVGITTTDILTKKRKRSCDDEKGVENQNKRIRKKPQEKKQQYPISALRATSMKQPPITLRATSFDRMLLILTRIDDDSSPACSVHDSQEKIESLKVQQNKTTQGNKKQDSIPAVLKVATMEAHSTLHATSCDNMPLLKRIDEESSPACSVHYSSDEDQENVAESLQVRQIKTQRKKQQGLTLRAASCDNIPLLKRFDELSPACSVYDSSDEDKENVDSLRRRHNGTQGKKQQDSIRVVKATSMKQPPTLCATSLDSMPLIRFVDESSQSSVHDYDDQEQVKSLHGHHTKTPGIKKRTRLPASKATYSLNMPLLTRFDEESSPACSIQDCEDKTESSDQDQEKVESPVQSPAPVISGLPEAVMPFPETLPLNSPLIALLPVGTTLVLTDPSTLRIIPSRTISTLTKETEIPHPKPILSQPPRGHQGNYVADSSKTLFRKQSATKKSQGATFPPSPAVNKRKLTSNKKPATATGTIPKSSPSVDGFAIPQSSSVYKNQKSLHEFGGNHNPSYWKRIGEALIKEGLRKAIRSNPSAKIGDNSISVSGGAEKDATPLVMTCEEFFALRKQKRKERLNHQPQITESLKSLSISAVEKSNQYSIG